MTCRRLSPVPCLPLLAALAAQATAAMASENDGLAAPAPTDPSRATRFALHAGVSGPAGYRFPIDPAPLMDQGAVLGIDLSHHNIAACRCVPDWSALARQHVRFAYFKASQGTDFRDPAFKALVDSHSAQQAAATIMLGAYHFLTANASAADQAEHFLDTVSGLPTIGLPPALDLEWDVAIGTDGEVVRDQDGKPIDSWASQTPESIIASVRTWLDLVAAKTGTPPIIYTNLAWWRERIGDEVPAALADHAFWLAQYAPSAVDKPKPLPRSQWLLWQFSSTARFLDGGLPPATQIDTSVANPEAPGFQGFLNKP